MNEMKNKRLTIDIILSSLLFAITYTIVFKQTTLMCDYNVHMNMAVDFWALIPFELTYPIWHFGVWLFYSIGHVVYDMPIEYACAFFSSVVNASIYLIISRLLKREKVINAEFVALSLCFVSAIYLPWYNSNVYLGQGSPVTWHNPTNLMVKPFAILAFFLIVSICNKIKKDKIIEKKEYWTLMILVFVSVLAKPSFFQGIVPSLAVYILFSLLLNRKKIKEYFLLCTTFVPAFCVMLYQFIVSFFVGDRGEGIGIGWGKALIYTPNLWISSLLVLAFPLYYTLVNIQRLQIETELQLAWIYVVVAWLEMVMLYEKGARIYDGNFGWAVLLAYTIIWIVTTKMFFIDWKEQTIDKNKSVVRNTILFLVWMLHLMSGLYYAYILIFEEGVWL